MKNGFTLVELSIVLVIIGLLIGGILIGQSLVDSARVNNEVRKISQWSIAVLLFEDKFKQYAGDSDYFIPSGNNDGDNRDRSGACPATLLDEFELTWNHLSQANMLNETYTWNSVEACAGNFVGIAPVADFLFYDGDQLPTSITSGNPGVAFAGKSYEHLISSNYKFYDFLAIENKLDDGTPSVTSGKIRGVTGDLIEICDDNGADIEAASQSVTKDEVICGAAFYFNSPITPN